MKNTADSRRRFIKSSALGLFGISVYNNTYAKNIGLNGTDAETLFYRYPSMNDSMVSGIVGASHTDLDKVKEMVGQRPELANSTWDWGFGDWETAIGAASHMGRRDIAEFLMSHGARPDIFTLAMMGAYKAVQDMVESMPGIQSTPGPHGITLLQHARNRLRITDISETDRNNVNKVISYLEVLGDADVKPKSLEITEEEQKIYLGEYKFGQGDDEIFTVNLNSRKLLQISRKGYSGRTMHKVDTNIFSPSGTPSVKISFKIKDGNAISLTIYEPAPVVNAIRV